MKRVIAIAMIMMLLLGLAFAVSPANHSIALTPSSTYVVVADGNDGSGNTTDGAGTIGGDNTDGAGTIGGDTASQSADNSSAVPTPTP